MRFSKHMLVEARTFLTLCLHATYSRKEDTHNSPSSSAYSLGSFNRSLLFQKTSTLLQLQPLPLTQTLVMAFLSTYGLAEHKPPNSRKPTTFWCCCLRGSGGLNIGTFIGVYVGLHRDFYRDTRLKQMFLASLWALHPQQALCRMSCGWKLLSAKVWQSSRSCRRIPRCAAPDSV